MKFGPLRTLLVATATLAVACSTAAQRDTANGDGDDRPDAQTTRPDDNSSSGGNGLVTNPDDPPPASGPEYYDFANPETCDSTVSLTGDAWEFAKTLGICKTATEDGVEWGLISAEYSNGFGVSGNPLGYQTGLLPKFGHTLTPREGQHLGVLSTMYAREYNSPNGNDTSSAYNPGGGTFLSGIATGKSNATVPPAFASTAANDLVSVRLRLRVPMNAKGLAFDFNFHSSEWPQYIGSRYNDHFVAMLTNQAQPNGANIAFDINGNPVTVNLGFFDRCQAGARVGCEGDSGTSTAVCPGGTAELSGTGFGTVASSFGSGTGCDGAVVVAGGATGWLTTQAVVEPGEIITLEFMVWNAYDHQLHSLVLLDNLRWETNGATGITRPN